MNVLILANNDRGLFGFRKELIEELIRNNTVYVSVPYGPCVDRLVEMGCKFIDTSLERRGTNPFKDLRLLSFYKKTIKRIHPDIVLTYTIKPNIYGGIACSAYKTPFIANITGLGSGVQNEGFVQRIILSLYKRSLKKASCVFFQNQENMEYMANRKIVNPEKAKLLPGSGVNLTENKLEPYPTEPNQITFVTICRITEEKGINELLEAINILKTHNKLLKFVLVGGMDGDLRSRIESAVNDGLIQYLGHRDDIHEIIKASSATIHPSYHEGTSNVLLETAACGRPIIASNVPGCNNTFIDGVTGIAFEPKNVHSIVKAVEKFLTLSQKEKEAMGLLGRKHVEMLFDRKIVVDSYIKEINRSKLDGTLQKNS